MPISVTLLSWMTIFQVVVLEDDGVLQLDSLKAAVPNLPRVDALHEYWDIYKVHKVWSPQPCIGRRGNILTPPLEPRNEWY